MTTQTTNADDLLTVSFSLQANPGAYALLLGAGVSAPSGIPTAWGVLEDLVGRVAEVQDATPVDPMRWYEEKFGEFPTYEGILERIAPTQIERQRLLRNYFEPSPEEVEAGDKMPTAAHRAIARLALSGAVRVIVTLNFDHLIERALRDVGIEPTVVASPADIDGMAPLHTLDCCVIHLHGDYLTPTSMLNTVTELEAYNPSMVNLLEMILENYGLVVAGWSSKYDPALRAAIAAHYPNRFTLTWFEPGQVSDEAMNLRVLKKGLLVADTADNGFGRLADGVEALTSRRARHPMTVPVVVETAKRELSGRTVSIGLHDTLKREFASLHQLPEFHLTDHNSNADYEDMLNRVEEATKLTGALVSTLAYWGNESTDNWWIDELPRFATPADGAGLVKLLSLRVISGSTLFYAAGVSAVSAQRFDLLNRLFALQRANRHDGGYEPLARALDSQTGYENAVESSTRMWKGVTPLLSEALSFGAEALDEAWQLFEILRLAWAVHRDPRFTQLQSEYNEKDRIYQERNMIFERAEKGDGDVDQARAVRATAWQDRGRALGSISHLARVGRPHVLVADMRMDEHYQSVIAVRLIHDLATEGTAHPLFRCGLAAAGSGFEVAVQAVSNKLGMIGSELSWDRVRNAVGTIPSQMWLDTGKTPSELAAEVQLNLLEHPIG